MLSLNKMVLNWITNGFHFLLNCIPHPFHHHCAAAMLADHIAFWKEHLLPHYLATGALCIVPLPLWQGQTPTPNVSVWYLQGASCMYSHMAPVPRTCMCHVAGQQPM